MLTSSVMGRLNMMYRHPPSPSEKNLKFANPPSPSCKKSYFVALELYKKKTYFWKNNRISK